MFQGKKKIWFALGFFLALTLGIDRFFVFPEKNILAVSQVEEFQFEDGEVFQAEVSDNLSNSYPRIDNQAWYVETGKASKAFRQGLPVEIWIFLLATYLGILIFNLAYDFSRTRKPRWVWESILTLLALGAWFVLDSPREALWFPLYVLKLGLITYVAYLVLFQNKKELEEETEQGSLF